MPGFLSARGVFEGEGEDGAAFFYGVGAFGGGGESGVDCVEGGGGGEVCCLGELLVEALCGRGV